jgi:hypothetical protein
VCQWFECSGTRLFSFNIQTRELDFLSDSCQNTKVQTTTRVTTNEMTSNGNYGMKLTKSIHLYRNTKVGVAMFDAIQELFELKKLTPQQALIIVAEFDNSIRKIMNKKIKENYSFFSFEAEVKAYRLQSGWCSVILENVAVYQHFRTSEVQWWYKCVQERRKKEGEKNKYFQKKHCDRFKNRARNNDVKVLCQEVASNSVLKLVPQARLMTLKNLANGAFKSSGDLVIQELHFSDFKDKWTRMAM